MTGLWVTVSALAILVVAQTVAILALARELGLMARRLPPAPALNSDEGPGVGNVTPPLQVATLPDRRTVSLTGGQGRRRVLIFMSTRCSPCRDLLPQLNGAARDWPDYELAPVISGEPDEADQMLIAAGYSGPAYHDSGRAAAAAGIQSTPRALVLDEEGVVLAQGVVNTREMISALVEGHTRVADAHSWTSEPLPVASQP